MRRCGATVSAEGLGVHDHLCWAFSEHEAFRVEATRCTREALGLGMRVMYVTDQPREHMRNDLRDVPELEARLAQDALRLVSIAGAYDPQLPADPPSQVDNYARE